MSNVSKWVMALIIGFVVIGLVKNAAGTVGIMLAGGTEINAIGGTLSGGKPSATKGTFQSGSTRIKLG